jgi:hypothetical protein
MQSQSQSSKPCGVRTRRGTPCPTPALPNGRCRMRGGALLRLMRALARMRGALRPCRRHRASRLPPDPSRRAQNPKNNPMKRRLLMRLSSPAPAAGASAVMTQKARSYAAFLGLGRSEIPRRPGARRVAPVVTAG